LAIPRQAFILWLAAHDSLTTGERLLSWALEVMFFVCFVEGVLKEEATYSLNVVSVKEFGWSV
jgi:hypothetical protein